MQSHSFDLDFLYFNCRPVSELKDEAIDILKEYFVNQDVAEASQVCSGESSFLFV
jgi:hypothetical protein